MRTLLLQLRKNVMTTIPETIHTSPDAAKSKLDALLSQKRDLEMQIASHQREERVTVIRQILQTMADHGLTTVDLARGKMSIKDLRSATRSKTPVAPKYRHPTTGETWSGRGLNPRWLTKFIAEGHSIESTRIA